MAVLKILIRCPVTKQILDTGLRASGREVLNTGIYGNGNVRCRFCGGFHAQGNAFADVEHDPTVGEIWRPNA